MLKQIRKFNNNNYKSINNKNLDKIYKELSVD